MSEASETVGFSGEEQALERTDSAVRPLRIAMVSARCFPFMGGIEAHIHETASRLARWGHSVTVLTTDPTGKLPERETVGGAQILRSRAYPANRDYYLAPGVYRHVMDGDWDVVHVQGYHTLVAPIGMLAAIRKGIPFVLTFHSGGHSSGFRQALRGAQWAMLRPLVQRASQLIGVSRYEADFFSRIMRTPRDRFIVAPNGAQLPEIGPGGAPPDEGCLILSIGRLEKYKGHHRAIEAMPELLRRRPDARLRVLGSGPWEQELRALTRRLGLEERVDIGAVPPAERRTLAALLANASLVVLLSEYEAHPVAVMEALSLGRKVLTADTSGFIELAEQGLVRSISLQASSAQIAAAMAEEIEAPARTVGFTLPGWDECAARLAGIYQSVLARAA